MDFNQKVGQLIRQRRMSRGLTQETVSDMIGMPTSSLSRIEQGRQPILLETWIQLASILDIADVSLPRLLSLTQPEPRPLWERINE